MRKLIKKILKEQDDLGWAQDIVNSTEIRPVPNLIVKRQTNNKKMQIEVHIEIMFGDEDGYERNTILFQKNGRGIHVDGKPNFNDFQKMVAFLKEGRDAEDLNDEESEYFSDLGVIGSGELSGYRWEIGDVNEVYYYDDMGNKYDAYIEGLQNEIYDTGDEDEEDDDYTEEE